MWDRNNPVGLAILLLTSVLLQFQELFGRRAKYSNLQTKFRIDSNHSLQSLLDITRMGALRGKRLLNVITDEE